MLTHKLLKAKDVKGGQLASYYSDGADDYYAKEGDSKQWQGKLCEDLGLTGDVDQETFKELLLGNIPGQDRPVRASQRNDMESRVGLDLTFQAPKSVSMQALVGGDPLIITAHEKAVSKVLAEMENLAQTRIKTDGKTRIVDTNALAIAKFRHETNRETEPHLHTHAIILNFTKADDGRYRALVNDKLVKNTKFWGAKYRSELASELVKAGYELRMDGDSFELAHISRSQIEAYSTRTAQINEELERKGLNRATATTDEKQFANYATRKKKEINTDNLEKREAIYKEWQQSSKDLGIDYSRREAVYDSQELEKISRAQVNDLKNVSGEEMAKRSVSFAINHFSERSAIMDIDVVKATAVTHGMGYCSPRQIDDEFSRIIAEGKVITADPLYTSPNDNEKRTLSRKGWINELVADGKNQKQATQQVDMGIAGGRLVKTKERFTTQAILEQEKRILKRELEGRGAVLPVLPKVIAKELLKETTLKSGQSKAAEMMLTTNNRFTGIQGLAGTGKSYLLQTTVPLLEKQGYNVVVLAPYGEQVKSLRADGIEAKTVAAWLNTQSRSLGLDDKTIVIVDEAGVVANRLMDRLTKLVNDNNARMTCLGDTEQTKAIENGMPFALMQRAGMETALMDDIQRQEKNPMLLEAVKKASVGKAKEALDLIPSVFEIKDTDTRYQNVAAEYTSLPKGVRDQTLVLSGTNESRITINENIRLNLGLEGKGTDVKSLLRWDSTQQERRFAKYYNIGDIIQPEINYNRTGLERYVDYKIVDKQGNRLVVEDPVGKLITFNPASHQKISVYHLRTQEYSVGDQVKITRNDAKLDLTNGDRFIVKGVKDNQLLLDDGKRSITLDLNKRQHIDYAYCTTVHSAQGLTAENVICNIEASSRTTSRDWFYVAISRAKNNVKIFTENAKALPEKVAKASEKKAAHDLQNEKVKKHLVKEKPNLSI